MPSSLSRLLSISSRAISTDLLVPELFTPWGPLGRQLLDLLSVRNGFYAFESALLVRPAHRSTEPLGLAEWNAPELWRREYTLDLSDALFFAEDIFGHQFCLRRERVETFNHETSEFEPIADSLESWTNLILSDYRLHTGHPLAHEWQAKHGPLPPGRRLFPKIPFMLGGAYTLDNLYPLEDVKGLRFFASLANQTRDLPDGATIRLVPKPASGDQ